MDSPGLQENLKRKHIRVRGQAANTEAWGAVARKAGAEGCAWVWE